MTISSERQHLEYLRNIYYQNLKNAEVTAAKTAPLTPSSVINEIADLQSKIAAIDVKLGRPVNAAVAASIAKTSSGDEIASPYLAQIQVRVEGLFTTFTSESEEETLQIVALLGKINRARIKKRKIASGSIVLWLELPAAAAQRLLDLQQSGDPILAALGIQEIKLLDSAQIASLNASQPTGGFQSALEQIRTEASRALDSIMIDTNNALEGIMARMRKTLQQSMAGAPSSPVATTL